MDYVLLKDVISFKLGKNAARINTDRTMIYNIEDSVRDLYSVNTVLEHPDCVLNLIKATVSPISVETADKEIPSNFVICQMDESKLDTWYFCWQFNEGKELIQQINMLHHGTTLSVKKLNIGMLENLKIKLPGIEEQRLAGKLYKESLKKYQLEIKKAEHEKKITLEIINKYVED